MNWDMVNRLNTQVIIENLDEYKNEVLRTARGMNDTYPTLFNAMLGLGGESGECLDIVKKWAFQGHELDEGHLAEELGDVLWYVTLAATCIGYDLTDIIQMNVDKLRTRYPDGFDADRSVNREKYHVE